MPSFFIISLINLPETSCKMIQTIEEISLNAWPSLQQILYDGWILRFANGHTKRANSVNPLYRGSQDVHEKIKICEQIYASKNLQPIFRITPLASPEDLDEILTHSGFEKRDITSVQVMNLELFTPWAAGSIQIWTEFSQNWLDSCAHLGGVTIDSQKSLISMLRNIASKKCFAVLLKENAVVSCGLGVLEQQYVGLFEIITARNERRKGFGEELMLNLLSWGKQNGAKKAYLQVVMNNQPALNLYSKLGFQEVYQYFYRMK